MPDGRKVVREGTLLNPLLAVYGIPMLNTRHVSDRGICKYDCGSSSGLLRIYLFTDTLPFAAARIR